MPQPCVPGWHRFAKATTTAATSGAGAFSCNQGICNTTITKFLQTQYIFFQIKPVNRHTGVHAAHTDKRPNKTAALPLHQPLAPTQREAFHSNRRPGQFQKHNDSADFLSLADLQGYSPPRLQPGMHDDDQEDDQYHMGHSHSFATSYDDNRGAGVGDRLQRPHRNVDRKQVGSADAVFQVLWKTILLACQAFYILVS